MRLPSVLLTLLLCGASVADDPVNLRRTVAVEVAEKTKHSVVYIAAQKLINQRFSLFGNDPAFQRFGPSEIRRVPVGSLGSGFIVHKDGYIVTNHHVTDRARQIVVELLDGRKLPARIISSDPEADLAILKIESDQPLPALELGDSSDLMIGEPVIAVGNPLGFSHTVSTGIVSAIHRDLKNPQGDVILGDLIQTDAAINPGNSGGPLLNAYGQVIGINTAIRGDAQNIGFAIQVNRLRDLVPDLMSPAQANKIDVPVRLKEERTLEAPSKVNVVVKDADSNRDIATIAGQRPSNIIDAYVLLLKQTGGTDFAIEYSDGKDPRTITPVAAPPPDAVVQSKKLLGLTVEELSPMLAQEHKLAMEEGLLVTAVDRDSIGARAGLAPGDVIVQLGRYRVSTLKDFAVLLQHLPPSGQVRIGVVRADTLGFGTLKL